MIRGGWRYKLSKNLKRRGLPGTVKLIALKIAAILRDNRPRIRRWKAAQRQFDREHGIVTETSQALLPEDMDIPSPNAAYGTPYQPTAIGELHGALEALGIDFGEYTFIDLGSGMGRALLMAADFPFRRIIGVEYAPDLHRQASQNIRNYRSKTRQCTSIEALCGDAAQFAFPPGNALIYMYNPFGREVMEPVLANVERSLRENPRDILVVYFYPELAEMLDRAAYLRPVSKSPRWAVYRTRTAASSSGL